MGYIGKKLRIRRLFYKGGDRGLIVPIDHGLTAGPLPGLKNIDEIKQWIRHDSISSIIVHKGLLERLAIADAIAPNTGVILHVNGMSLLDHDADTKEVISTIETAIRYGADAVSLQVNFSENNYHHNIKILAQVTEAASATGLPVLTMLYDKVKTQSASEVSDRLHKLIRLVTELGSDLVKVSYPGTEDNLKEITSLHGGNIKILIAGGEQITEDDFCLLAERIINAGANGLCAGRNIFQSKSPSNLLSRLEHICKGNSFNKKVA